jgi:hypothetical protein
MTFVEADNIVSIWGAYIEYCQDRLRALFISNIPQSLLPYPVETLEEALNIVGKFYHEARDYEASKLIQESFGCLAHYAPDDTALQGAAFKFGAPNVREAIIRNIKKVQVDWIRTAHK